MNANCLQSLTHFTCCRQGVHVVAQRRLVHDVGTGAGRAAAAGAGHAVRTLPLQAHHQAAAEDQRGHGGGHHHLRR